MARENDYPCPCCGYLVFDKSAGSYDICPICFWEDDIVQLVDPLLAGGANQVSLLEGQQNYLSFGACEERIKQHVRPPLPDEQRDKQWHPFDPAMDRPDGTLEAWWKYRGRIEQHLHSDRYSEYYWSPTYWGLAFKAEQEQVQQQTPASEEGNQ